MRYLFEKVLWNTGEVFYTLSLKFKEFSSKFQVKELKDFSLEDLSMTPFVTFKEGLSSANYFTRHKAASEIVGWYVHEGGQPMLDDIITAARVLLEDYDASDGDISFLVGAWKDQASAITPEQKESAREREDKIYQDLASKLQSKN